MLVILLDLPLVIKHSRVYITQQMLLGKNSIIVDSDISQLNKPANKVRG